MTSLSPADIVKAKQCAQERYARRRQQGSGSTYGLDMAQWNPERETEAIGAEIFCSNALGIEWIDSDKPDHEGDLGRGKQVRSTPLANGRLLVHEAPRDNPYHAFYLVTGVFPQYKVHGWLLGKDAQSDKWWTAPQPGRFCYAVPQSELRPMTLEPPRWKNGPEICEQENLPAFECKSHLLKWHAEKCPGAHIIRIGRCRFCGMFHAQTVARGPGGESSGTGRFNKHKE